MQVTRFRAPCSRLEWCSPPGAQRRTRAPGGYRYDDLTIRGFALTRLSGTGCGNLGDLPIMPSTRPFSRMAGDPVGVPFATFRHERESASPGRYHVEFSTGLRADLTATLRTGFARFVFPGESAYIALDAGGGATDQSAISIPLANRFEARGSITDDGNCGGPASPTLHFVARFDRPVRTLGSWRGTVKRGVATEQTVNTGGLELGFGGASRVQVKIGVSYVSLANAALNLARESPGWNFDRIAARARASWNRVLGRVKVRGGTPQRARSSTRRSTTR